MMNLFQFTVEILLGLMSGAFLGVTGIAPTGIILIALDVLKIGDYKSNLGSVLFLNLFPITFGSVFEFYKSKQINFTLGSILLITTLIGSYLGSKLVVGTTSNALSEKIIKYITAYLSLFMGAIFLYSAYFDY
jgi:uncharacterized membrane protein YfcA